MVGLQDELEYGRQAWVFDPFRLLYKGEAGKGAGGRDEGRGEGGGKKGKGEEERGSGRRRGRRRRSGSAEADDHASTPPSTNRSFAESQPHHTFTSSTFALSLSLTLHPLRLVWLSAVSSLCVRQ